MVQLTLVTKYFYIHKFEETIKYLLLVQIILDSNLGYMCQNRYIKNF